MQRSVENLPAISPSISEEPPSRAGSLALIGGAACLDFANTSSGRGGPHRLEHLRSYELLLVWSEHAGLLTAPLHRDLLQRASNEPDAATAIWQRALVLREAIHSTAEMLAHRASPAADGLQTLNRELSRAMSQAALHQTGDGFAWDWSGAEPALDRPLWPIARSAADLLTGADPGRIKQCPGQHCGWVFLDLTKNGRRRWCEMEVCGSRAKVRRYRARQRQAGG
jgi:predicted RNA-binding Zn ribbon-like protein